MRNSLFLNKTNKLSQQKKGITNKFFIYKGLLEKINYFCEKAYKNDKKLPAAIVDFSIIMLFTI